MFWLDNTRVVYSVGRQICLLNTDSRMVEAIPLPDYCQEISCMDICRPAHKSHAQPGQAVPLEAQQSKGAVFLAVCCVLEGSEGQETEVVFFLSCPGYLSFLSCNLSNSKDPPCLFSCSLNSFLSIHSFSFSLSDSFSLCTCCTLWFSLLSFLAHSVRLSHTHTHTPSLSLSLSLSLCLCFSPPPSLPLFLSVLCETDIPMYFSLHLDLFLAAFFENHSLSVRNPNALGPQSDPHLSDCGSESQETSGHEWGRLWKPQIRVILSKEPSASYLLGSG